MVAVSLTTAGGTAAAGETGGLDVEPARRLSNIMWRHDLVRAQVESGWRQAPDRL